MRLSFTSAVLGLSGALMFAACGGVAQLAPTASSPVLVNPIPRVNEAPVGSSINRELLGTLGPFDPEAESCFADLFPCETFDFTLPQEGPIEVTLTWEGSPRAVFVQLYWAGRWLAHEDVAPREGPSRISFLRPRMEANNYQLRIVAREPGVAIPFRLVLSY